jgi:hypothetical protein
MKDPDILLLSRLQRLLDSVDSPTRRRALTWLALKYAGDLPLEETTRCLHPGYSSMDRQGQPPSLQNLYPEKGG